MSVAVFWIGVAAFIWHSPSRVIAPRRLADHRARGGRAGAIFYVAPPIRWAYRAWGNRDPGLSYGPWMVLGSLYLHASVVVGRVAGIARAWVP
jgi:1,4-dihydroxy-2-naphthoate octaprenyltransferase